MSDILSRVEDILDAIVNGNEVDFPRPQSRVEKLLWQLSSGVVILDQDGLIPLNVIPKVAFAECVTVENDTARFALTTDDVHNGDTVYVNDTQIMYFVVDDTKLDMAAGYKPLAAGIAAQAVADKNGNDITTEYVHDGGTFIEVNGIRLYVSSTAPTGNIPDGSVGVGW